MATNKLARGFARVITVLTVLGWPGVLPAETYTWKSVVVPGGGYVSGINYSPVSQGLLYARTDIGGFYRWDSSTSRWIPLNDMFGPSQTNYFGGESIAPDPVDPNVVYAAAGMYTGSGNGVILSSTDQGDTWTLNPIGVLMGGNNDGREAGERLAVDPNLTSKLYFASRDNGLWVSTNTAASWSYVASFPVLGDSDYGLAYVVFDPNGTPGSASATIYVGVMAMSSDNSNLYRSTDVGANWAVVPGGPVSMITTHASLGTDGTLWVVYNSGGYGPNGISAGQVWKLDTSSLAWTNVTPSGGPPPGQGGYGGISVDAQNAQHVIVSTLDWWSGADHVFSTTNGGGSWSVIANKYVGWNVGPFSNFDNNGAIYTRGCGGNDGYVGWAGDIKIDPFNANNAVYTTGGGVWSSTNINASSQPAGVTWAFTNYGLEETVPLALNAASAGGVFFSALGDVGGLRHTDPDQSPASGAYCNPFFSNTNDIDFAELNTNIVVRVGNSGAVTTDTAYSTDNGLTWSPWGIAPPGYTTNNQMGFVAVAADGSRVVVAPYRGHGSPAYASSLGGSWTACSGLPSGAVLASDRANASTLYAIYPNRPSNGTVTVYASTDYGANFSQVNTIPSAGWGQAAPRAVFDQAGEFWVSSGIGLFRFTNGGSTKAQIANVTSANSVGFGKAAPGQSHPAVYLIGTVGGTFGFFRCDDGIGSAWTRINDAGHQYGNPGLVGGDEDVFGRVYIGAGGRGILYGDVVMASPTITPTSACGADTCTPTVSPTPTVTLTPTTAPCLMLLNGCNSIFENGTWTGSNAERGIVSSCPATAAFPSEGSGCLAVTVTTGDAFNAGILNLTGITPSNFAGFAQLTLDIYFPPEMVAGQGWAQLALVGDSAVNNVMFQYLSSDMPSVTAGFNTCRFNLNYPGALTSAMDISAIKFVYNAQNAVTGTLYVDNIRLVNPCGLWTATPSPTDSTTATPSPSLTATATLSPSPVNTETPTVTGTLPTETPTPTTTDTPSITDTPTASTTATFTSSPSLTATATLSPSPSPSHTATPSATPTPSDTPGITSNEIGLPYPNPVGGSESVTVGLQVPEPSTVTLAVYTTAFRKIWNGTREVSGQADVLWDLKDNWGKFVANGLYYLKITVTNNSSTTTKILKIIVRR